MTAIAKPRRLLLGAAALVLGAVATAPAADATTAAQNGVQVSIVGQAYVPVIVTVVAGDSVTWVNNDTETHSVNLGDGFGDQLLLPGEAYAATFPNLGEYAYFCTLHGHAGKVVVAATAPTTVPPTDPPTSPPAPRATVPPSSTAPAASTSTAAPTTTGPGTTDSGAIDPRTTAAGAAGPGSSEFARPTTPTTSATSDESLPLRIGLTGGPAGGDRLPAGLLATGAAAGAGVGVGGGIIARRRARKHKAPKT